MLQILFGLFIPATIADVPPSPWPNIVTGNVYFILNFEYIKEFRFFKT